MDHLKPRRYVGVDASERMLFELLRKHPEVAAINATVGKFGWTNRIPIREYDVITATWALQYFPENNETMHDVLVHCERLVRPGGYIALHGCLPRRAHRDHYIAEDERPVPVIKPHVAKWATQGTGLDGPRLTGTGACPDWLARTEFIWMAALTVPARWHYTGLFVWRRP
jgi:SAM-dependent methyltransferase